MKEIEQLKLMAGWLKANSLNIMGNDLIKIAENIREKMNHQIKDGTDQQDDDVKWLELMLAILKQKIAEEIYDDLIYDLTDRRGLNQQYWQIDDDVRLEIKHTWIKIIKNKLSNFSV
jgi:signal recognition particle GTPase